MKIIQKWIILGMCKSSKNEYTLPMHKIIIKIIKIIKK